jgi:hypothetical protein
MPSRRRSRNKNIGNNLAEVSRRLRTIERRPVRTKLGNRIVKTSSLAPNAVGPDEVNFGTAIIVTDPDTNNTYVENPKDGLFVVSSTTGSTSVYSEKDDNFYPLSDPLAQADAAQAADDAAAAADAADAAEIIAIAARTSANGKNAVFRQSGAPTATKIGDIWFDTSPNALPGDLPKRWTGTAWEDFGLNYAAIKSIDAGTITTGTLTASISMTSPQITGGSISGVTFTTLGIGSGNNIRIGTTNFQSTITFTNFENTTIATLTPFLDDSGAAGLVIHTGPSPTAVSGYNITMVNTQAIDIGTPNNIASMSFQNTVIFTYNMLLWNFAQGQDQYDSEMRGRNIAYGTSSFTVEQPQVGEGNIYLQYT